MFRRANSGVVFEFISMEYPQEYATPVIFILSSDASFSGQHREQTTIKRKRTRAKKPKKIPSVHMDHPDWPWPLHYWELRHPVWWQQREYRERRIFYRSIGKTGLSEETRAQVRKWKAENGY
jgi:hypothetical protein